MRPENDRTPAPGSNGGKSDQATESSVTAGLSKFQQAMTVVRRAPEFVAPVITGRITLATACRQASRHPDIPEPAQAETVRPLRRLSGCPAGCARGSHSCGVGDVIAVRRQDDGRELTIAEREFAGAA